MKIYLDCCAYNRPYDDLSQISVDLEAQAKLKIQTWIREDRFELVSSEILMAETNENPYYVRKKSITDYIKENSSVHVGPANNENVNMMAKDIMHTGLKYKDACHVASAIIAGCEYLISTDKRMLKYRSEKIRLLNPIQFVNEMEENRNDR